MNDVEFAAAVSRARSALWGARLTDDLRRLRATCATGSPEARDFDRYYRQILKRLPDYSSGLVMVPTADVKRYSTGFSYEYDGPLWYAVDPSTTEFLMMRQRESAEKRMRLEKLIYSMSCGLLDEEAREEPLDRVTSLAFAIREEKKERPQHAFLLGRLLARETVYLSLRSGYADAGAILWSVFQLDTLRDLIDEEGYTFSTSESCFRLFVEALREKLALALLWTSGSTDEFERPLAHNSKMDLTSRFVLRFATPGMNATDSLIEALNISAMGHTRGLSTLAVELKKSPIFETPHRLHTAT